jgi:chromate reductase, NAD(P)H dehydrogenase (quinone)
MRVLGISGSLRHGSLNTALLRTAAERLPAGAELVEFGRLREIPPYDEDLEAAAPEVGRGGVAATGLEAAAPEVGRGGVAETGLDAVAELREAIRAADAVLIATPEYNHSIPGQLKNALDWASRPAGKSALNGKPAAAIGASTGMFGAVWAQAETRKVLSALGGRVIEEELPIGHAQELRDGDQLKLEPNQSEQLTEILAELVAAAEPAAMAFA